MEPSLFLMGRSDLVCPVLRLTPLFPWDGCLDEISPFLTVLT